ncbi:MAG: AMIN domain-containing protein, partial [candidate division Zixibacteria bacterium]|nr:AMIN domain-containing protein [candidate division Zixibacteria bacterium]
MRTSYTTKLPYLILGFLFFVAFTPAPSPARGSCRIKNISLKKQGNFTQVSIYADKQFEFSHFTEEAKGGKPYRVVIDCKNAIFDLPRKNYKTGLPPGSITGIRTGQFQAVPEQIVRVVLDLKGPVVYKVVDPETENEASIAILTTQDPDFPMWVAVLGEKKDQKVSLEKKQSKILPTEIASKEEQRSDQSKASLVGAVGSTDLTASEKGEAKIVQKERVYRRTVCYADTGESIMSLKEKPVLLSQIKSEHEDIKKEELAKEEAEPSQKRRSLRETLSYVDTGETILPVEEEPVLLSEVQSDIEEIKIEERVSQVIEPLPVLPTPEFSWEVYS